MLLPQFLPPYIYNIFLVPSLPSLQCRSRHPTSTETNDADNGVENSPPVKGNAEIEDACVKVATFVLHLPTLPYAVWHGKKLNDPVCMALSLPGKEQNRAQPRAPKRAHSPPHKPAASRGGKKLKMRTARDVVRRIIWDDAVRSIYIAYNTQHAAPHTDVHPPAVHNETARETAMGTRVRVCGGGGDKSSAVE